MQSAANGRNLNPPHASTLFLPFALLDPAAGLAAWLLLSALALADCCRLALRELEWRPGVVSGLGVLLFLTAWAPAAALVITMQLSLLLMWPVVKGWVAMRRNQWARAGLWLGVAASVKLFLLLFLPFFLLTRRAAAARTMLATVLLAFGAGWMVFGGAAYARWIHQFDDVSWHGHYMNASMWGAVERGLRGFGRFTPVLDAPSAVIPAWAVSVLLLVSAWSWLVWRDRAHGSADVHAGFAVVTALLASPLGWVYYAWLAVVPVGVAAAQHAKGRLGVLDAGLAAVAGAGLLSMGSFTVWLQPHGWATVTIASGYSWALLAVWTWLALAVWRNSAGSPRAALAEAPTRTGARSLPARP
jgi:hypothetical protein